MQGERQVRQRLPDGFGVGHRVQPGLSLDGHEHVDGGVELDVLDEGRVA